MLIVSQRRKWISYRGTVRAHTDVQGRKLLKYLDDKDISATFFVVGSRVISYPDILIAEYMAGHEIAVHTWSHHVRTPHIDGYHHANLDVPCSPLLR